MRHIFFFLLYKILMAMILVIYKRKYTDVWLLICINIMSNDRSKVRCKIIFPITVTAKYSLQLNFICPSYLIGMLIIITTMEQLLIVIHFFLGQEVKCIHCSMAWYSDCLARFFMGNICMYWQNSIQSFLCNHEFKHIHKLKLYTSIDLDILLK
jgi:hypothetical protein